MFLETELDNRQLRYFGASLASLLLGFAGIAKWKWGVDVAAMALAATSMILFVIYYALPSARRPIYRGFQTVTKPIQVVMSYMILGIVYFAVLTPIGILLRLRGISVRNRHPDTATYWKQRREAQPSSRYFDTF